MDRLICGDVGFGKTEVALRAAFVAVLSGHQVAIVVPTTLLARQHFETFGERFARLPGSHRTDFPAGSGAQTGRDQGKPCRGELRHRDRHSCAAWEIDSLRRSRAFDRRRGTAFRRCPQGALEETPCRRSRADHDGDAHPTNLATRPFRREGDERDRHTAARSRGGSKLRAPLRSGHRPRGDPARTPARGSGLLCLSANRGFAKNRRAAQAPGSGGAHSRGLWPDGGARA